MYTEENARGRFPLRDILLKAIVVIIFIILIIFIISKVTGTAKKDSTNNYDKVFSENLKVMEEGAFLYFTEDKLPKKEGNIVELTLREMVNSNLIEAFTDSNGKSCDVDNSYIRLTKNIDDYTLRVSLKCQDKEDYSLKKVGQYSYCENTLCVKDSSKEESEEEKQDEEQKEVNITEPVVESNNNTSNNTESNNNYSNSNSNSQNSAPAKIVMYEYKKVVSPVLSNWSSWSDWKLNGQRYNAIKCDTNDTSCLKEIQLYSRKEYFVTKDGKLAEAMVHYYSVRTRNLISDGYTDVKWSTYNDTSLLNNGYTYTGNSK